MYFQWPVTLHIGKKNFSGVKISSKKFRGRTTYKAGVYKANVYQDVYKKKNDCL